jgi:lipopolysaccharide export system ATP-binding protein
MRPLFSADSIGKAFGSTVVLKAASIWATPGRITVVFGRNGCGKSTLMKVGAGLLPADSGVVHFDGRAFLRPRLHRLAALGLFYLPDRGLLSSRWTLRQHFAALQWRHPGARGVEMASELGLAPLMDQRPTALSGGERRRAEVVLACAREPRCLLADEPFAGISPRDAEAIAGVLRGMAASGCAIVVTGHEVPQLVEIADEVVWMTAGTTHGLGTADQAATHDQFRREYLGPGRAF